MSKLKKLVIFLAVLVLVIPAGAFGYLYFKLDSMHDKDADNSLLDNTDYKAEKGITNILLVGTDGRSDNDSGTRSDAMMILTVDENNKSLKLTSLARDAYVEIPGRSTEKLTHAYAYGGINLLVETIEKNFELDIQNYAVVDFFSFMDIVDALGGVTVNVKSDEIAETNYVMQETFSWYVNDNNESIEFLDTPGTQSLNGYQALAFSRIRKNDSATERDRRQREVIQGLVNGAKSLSITKYPSLIDTILPYVKTNMRPTEIMSLGTSILSLGNLEINQMEFPIHDNVNGIGGELPGKGWVLQFTPNSLNILHDFIFSANTDK